MFLQALPLWRVTDIDDCAAMLHAGLQCVWKNSKTAVLSGRERSCLWVLEKRRQEKSRGPFLLRPSKIWPSILERCSCGATYTAVNSDPAAYHEFQLAQKWLLRLECSKVSEIVWSGRSWSRSYFGRSSTTTSSSAFDSFPRASARRAGWPNIELQLPQLARATTTSTFRNVDEDDDPQNETKDDCFQDVCEEQEVQDGIPCMNDGGRVELPKDRPETGLYLVGTPIGNLEDISLRALRILRQADVILAEDTRHSSKLMHFYSIKTPLISFHQFNAASRVQGVVQRLQRGEVVALISDAGMPGISDPGSELVAECVAAGVRVFPVPGPAAVIAALVASGLPTFSFTFLGFPPAQPGHRRRMLASAAKSPHTQVLYVPPHKLPAVLDDCVATFGAERRCTVAREITKIHEEFWRGTLEAAWAEFSERRPRGEMTVVVEGMSGKEAAAKEGGEGGEGGDDMAQASARLRELLEEGLSVAEASKRVAQEMSIRRNVVYPLAVKLSKGGKKLVDSSTPSDSIG